MDVPRSENSSRALRVEIIGLAGAGKTTLIRTLMSMEADLQVGLHLPKAVIYRHVVNRSLGLFPSFLRQLPGSRWFNTKETKAIIYLEAWRRALTRGVAGDRDAILFDHGPLFWLTRIRAIGPAFARSLEPERWWRGEVLRWAGLLDALVFLDAPDAVLMHRIRTREQDHIVKHDSDETIRRFLSRFRSAFCEATTIASEDGRIERYDFDTTLKRPQQIAESVLEIIEQRREVMLTR